ncbi:MAG TPA: type II toxin-antitoxin system HicB family antitoxin [Candidatus Binatia bacterium]|jgi:antitoxin HicB|nr:type II toxin-antitoxin system HicB family antitoxin [Candidatus Binatia bacterium]
MERFVYPATLTPDAKDGGFVVTFIDVPEAVTQGENVEDALREAADCLEEAIANRMVMGLPLPPPSPVKKRQYTVPLPAQTAAKAALYIALQEAKITKAELAKRLQCDEKEVRRLLDPRHPSKLPRIESALAAVGQRLIVGLQSAA